MTPTTRHTLAATRKARGFTQAAFRALLKTRGIEISQQGYSQYEVGRCAPSARAQVVIAQLLGADRSELFPTGEDA